MVGKVRQVKSANGLEKDTLMGPFYGLAAYVYTQSVKTRRIWRRSAAAP
ncbi:hypothetical protein [Bradyrhizobium sp. BR 1432]